MNRKQRRAATKDPAAGIVGSINPQASRLFLAAVQYHQRGQIAEAEAAYRQALALEPLHAEACSNLSLALRSTGRVPQAISACRRAIVIRPQYLEAQLNLIDASQAIGQPDGAITACRRVAALRPDFTEVQNNLGVMLQQNGRLPEAIEAYRAAIAIKNDYADAHSNLGMALHDLGQHPEAIAECQLALAINPYSAEALSNLGGSLRPLGRLAEAIGVYRRAVIFKPGFAGVYSNLGMGLNDQGKVDEAADACHRSVLIEPNDPEALCNYGVAVEEQGSAKSAVIAYQRAVSLRCGYASAYSNLGMALHEEHRFDEAVTSLRHAIAIRPNYAEAISEYVQMRRHICDWGDYAEDQHRLLELLEQNQPVASFVVLAIDSTPRQQLISAKQSIARMHVPPIPPFSYRPPDRKIRVGYISTDFRDHPVGRLLPELFRRHDRAQLQIHGYYYGPDDQSVVRQQIRRDCDQFLEIRNLSHIDAARRIHADGIDILVDLTGRTLGARTEILALRPAPVQVSFLGYPGSMGADFIDYVITDPFLVPIDQQPHYAENIVHLPDCYQPSDPNRAVSNPAPTRAECGLPEDALVFCSFNNTYKITPQMFAIWMRLLKQVPRSVLWLYCKTEQTIANLRDEAERQGVAPERIIFTGFAPMEVYLGKLQLADLFLDSAPYNAGATCNDALWVGLPVLTCVGQSYVGRMAGSLLTAVGLPELITYSHADYEALALRLATEPALLSGLRQKLIANRATAPLFDMGRFANNLDKAYQQMMKICWAGEVARPFAV